ncbi:uncharacterized protein LOC106457717 isoform X2 [Limulus polyphemus]|uniref:Alpha-latrotoxin n=1 Tax=Limulus polyphemus TaxID=6850 RepID=A0ABM1S729_LIMPO|nr:uncharacterized protein LOC106457717 isoform X2 [Limulus polyphemus]
MKKVLKATKIFMSSKKEAKPNAFSDHSNTGLANQRSSTASQGSTWNINSTSLCTSLGYKVDLTLESEDKRFTKLHKACWLGSEDKVKKHIKKIDVNSRDNENRLPLHLATAQGHKSIVEYLIAHKALIDVIDGEGRTPLMKAVECYHADIVEFLLTCGANGNLSDKYGDTSLHLAVRTGQPEVAFTLLKQRLDVNARNAEGWTPLHVATAQRQQNVVKCLLEMGALINSADEEGKTPLMLASKAGNAPLVSLLLSSGANIEMQDNQGWTALDFAALTCKSEIVDILTQNMKTVEESAKESDPESGAHDKDTWNDNDSINEYLNLEQNEPEIVIKEDLPSPVISSSHEPGAPMEVESLEAKERKHGSTEKEFAAVEQRKLDFLKEFGLSDPSEVSTPEISNISDLKEKQNDERSQNIRDDTDIDQDLSTVDEASQHQEGGRISEETDAEKEYLISGTYLTDEDKLQPASEVTKSILKSDWMIAAHSSSESESEVEDIVSPSYIPSASVVRRRSSTHIYSPDVSPTKQPLSFPTTYHSSHPEQTPTSSSPSHSIAPFSKNSVVDSPESPSSKHIYKRKHFSESPETSFHDDKMFGFTSSVGIPPKELMIKEDHALVDPSDVLTDSEWDSEASACSNEENIINKSMNQQENGLEKAKDQETKNMGDSRKREDSYLEQSKETSCPESLEGTLGRPNTLQGSEEMWEKNAIVSVKDVKDSNGEKQEDFPKHLHSFSFSSENSFINVEDSQVATNYNNINADVFSQTTNISAKYIDKTQFVDNQLLCNTRDGGKELDKCIVSCVDEAEETNNKENKYEVEPVFRSLEKSVFDIVQREVCTEARSLENDNPNMLEKIFTEEHNENIHSSITSSKQHDLVEEIFDYQVRDIEHLDSKDNQKVEQTFINQNHVLKFDSKNLQKDTVLLSDTRDVQETVGDSVSCSDSEQICNISNGHGFVSKNNLEVLIHEDNKQFQYDALSTTLGIEKAEEETVSDAVAVFVGDGKNSQSSRVPEKKLPRPTFLNLQGTLNTCKSKNSVSIQKQDISNDLCVNRHIWNSVKPPSRLTFRRMSVDQLENEGRNHFPRDVGKQNAVNKNNLANVGFNHSRDFSFQRRASHDLSLANTYGNYMREKRMKLKRSVTTFDDTPTSESEISSNNNTINSEHAFSVKSFSVVLPENKTLTLNSSHFISPGTLSTINKAMPLSSHHQKSQKRNNDKQNSEVLVCQLSNFSGEVSSKQRDNNQNTLNANFLNDASNSIHLQSENSSFRRLGSKESVDTIKVRSCESLEKVPEAAYHRRVSFSARVKPHPSELSSAFENLDSYSGRGLDIISSQNGNDRALRRAQFRMFHAKSMNELPQTLHEAQSQPNLLIDRRQRRASVCVTSLPFEKKTSGTTPIHRRERSTSLSHEALQSTLNKTELYNFKQEKKSFWAKLTSIFGKSENPTLPAVSQEESEDDEYSGPGQGMETSLDHGYTEEEEDSDDSETTCPKKKMNSVFDVVMTLLASKKKRKEQQESSSGDEHSRESERQSSRPSKTPPKPPPRKTRRVTDEKSPFDVESSLTLTTSPEVEENLQITKLLQGDFDSTTDNEDSITEDSPVPKIPEISPENIRTVNGLQQIQEVLRKQYFIAVKERHDKNNLKSRLNTLKCERSTLQSKLRAEKASHNGLQKKILTLEKELLELKYRIEQEMNSKMDAESLLKTVQNQLTSTLVSYNSETEAKAVLQKQVDSLNKDVKTYNTTIKDLKDEILNWKNKLEEEQSKPSKPLSPSQMKNSNAEEEMVKYATQMKLLEHQNEQYEGENTSLKAQLKILQKELENKEAEWIERIKSITVEREDLENKCEILQKEAAVVHESLDSVSYRYTSNYTNLAEEKEKLENRLAEELKDKEAKEKELNENKAKLKRLEQELAEVQEELRSTRNNLTEQSDKFQKIKIQEHAEKENLLADNSDLKKQLSEATQKVKELKTCLEKNEHDSSLMNMNMHSELDKMQIMFKEKINQSEKLEKEIEEERKKCVRIEIESRHTAEENKKLCDKVNNLQDKLLSQQQEIATLRVQYEDAKVKTVAEKNTNVSSEKCTLDSLLASLRSEHEKFRSMLEEQIESLKITVENLREELKVKDSKLWELELELRQTHREISEYQRELSKLDSTKEISKKTIEEHCLEQSRLRTEISKLQEALQETKQKYGLAETEVKTLQKQLNEAYSVNKNNASKPVLEKELAEVLQRLHKSETHRKNLEATVQKNNKKIEDLGSNLENTSQKKQELENTVKDLKKKNEDLERRLFEAKLTYSVYSREAEESRHLWQHETKTISHLGIKLSEVEKQKKDLEATVTDCQKKVSKALQVKKVAEIRLQQEQDRIQQLKEDIINYKTHLKRAKQKIEDFEKFPAEVRLLTQEREFTQKKEKLLDRISDQRRQIEKLEEQLNKEQVLHHQAEEINRKLSAELVSLRGEEPSQIHQLRAELELLKAGSFKGNLLFPKSLSDSWRPEAHQDHLTKLLNNINTELHNQSLTRDIMEKDRAKSEASIRQDFLRNKNNYMLSTKETERGDLEQNLDRLKRKLEAEQLARKSLETQMYATGGSQVVRQLNNLPADSKILNNFRSATVSGSQESVVRRNSQPIQFSTPNSDLPLNSLPVWPSSPVRKHQQEKLGAGLSSSVEAVYPTPLSYHFQAELDKIFKKKLASDPHIDIAIPASISHETKSLDSASDKTASDYLETLQKRYCV